MMDRAAELEPHLPTEAWKNYRQGIPVCSRDGDYLGRDFADTSRINNRLAFGTIGVSLLTALSHSSAQEPYGMVGFAGAIAFFVTPGIIKRVSGTVFRDKKVINP